MTTETETLCKLYLELANIVPETCVSSREFALRVDLSAETDAGKHWKDRAIAAEAREARLREVLEELDQWSQAYPLKVFPEPDFAEVRKLLAAGGITVDAVSASNMRHVITRVGEIVRAALEQKP